MELLVTDALTVAALATGLLGLGLAGSAPYIAARHGAAGPTSQTVVGEREGERQARRQEETEQANSVARPAIETGSGGAQGATAPSGGMPT